MNVNYYLITNTENLTTKWERYDNLDLKERSNLYKDTQELFEKLPENASPDLQEKVENLRKFIFDEGFDTIISKKFPVLFALIKKSTAPSLHHLMHSDYLSDINPTIYSQLTLKDLLAMRQATKATKHLAEKELIRRLNKAAPTGLISMQAASRSLQFLVEDEIFSRMNGAIGSIQIKPLQSKDKDKLDLSNLNISTLAELRSFFDEEVLKDLTYLDLSLDTSEKTNNVSQLIAINLIEITECCPYVKVLTLRDRPLLSTNTNSSIDLKPPTGTKSKKGKSKSVFSKFPLPGFLKKKSGSSKEKNSPLTENNPLLETYKTCGIRILELSYIKEIEGKKLTNLDFLKLCPELEQFSLEGCEYINNTEGLAFCKKLNHLDIRNAFQIDDLGAAVHYCLLLEVIDIHGINNIPPEQMASLKERNVKFNISF